MVYVDGLTGFAQWAHYPSSALSSAIINTIREFFIVGVWKRKYHSMEAQICHQKK